MRKIITLNYAVRDYPPTVVDVHQLTRSRDGIYVQGHAPINLVPMNDP